MFLYPQKVWNYIIPNFIKLTYQESLEISILKLDTCTCIVHIVLSNRNNMLEILDQRLKRQQPNYWRPGRELITGCWITVLLPNEGHCTSKHPTIHFNIFTTTRIIQTFQNYYKRSRSALKHLIFLINWFFL